MQLQFADFLYSFFKDKLIMHFVDIGKRPPVFDDGAIVALEILKCPYEFDFGEMYFNVFKWVISFCSNVFCCVC